MSDVVERVRALIARELHVDIDRVKPEARFAEDLGADHIDTLSLAINLEDEFGVTLTDVQVELLVTVHDAIAAAGGTVEAAVA